MSGTFLELMFKCLPGVTRVGTPVNVAYIMGLCLYTSATPQTKTPELHALLILFEPEVCIVVESITQ